MYMSARWFSLFLSAVFVSLALLTNTAAAALLITSTGGNLIFQALSGHGDTSNQEFGIGTPAIGSLPSERQVVFTLHLYRDSLDSVTPSATVNMGYFPAGSALDFYQISDYYGSFWAFSSHAGSARTPSDIAVFSDPDNSLGFGGTVVEVLSVDDWVLHLDDAASFAFDDDDNELLIRVFVDPVHRQIPEPTTLALVTACLATLWLSRRLSRKRRHDQRTRLNASPYGWKAIAVDSGEPTLAKISPSISNRISTG